MSKFTLWLRKYAGAIISFFGFALLVIITFGDIGELFTEDYWRNVGGNLTSLGAMTIGLTMIQVSIKQGISEQALSTGLNTETTKNKYKEHKEITERNKERFVYLPYFLQMRNSRETQIKKKEYLVSNNFTSEQGLINYKYTGSNLFKKHSFNKQKRKLIKKYKSIKVNITVDSIKWSTTDIVYTKDGRIEKLDLYRKKRATKGLLNAFLWMFGTAFITGGMFLSTTEISIVQKLITLATYVLVIGLSSLLDIGKNYEKGAFGVPNELDEINNIWCEFEKWNIPKWVLDEVEEVSKAQDLKVDISKKYTMEVTDKNEERKETVIPTRNI